MTPLNFSGFRNARLPNTPVPYFALPYLEPEEGETAWLKLFIFGIKPIALFLLLPLYFAYSITQLIHFTLEVVTLE